MTAEERFCPNCGEALTAGEEMPVAQDTWQPAERAGTAAQPEVNPEAQPAERAGAAVQPEVNPEAQPTGQAEPDSLRQMGGQTEPNSWTQPEKRPEKKRRGFLIGGIVAAVILLLAVAFGGRGAENFFRRTFSSPLDYYRYIESRETKKQAAEIADAYGNYKNWLEKALDSRSEGETRIELGEKGKELAGSLSGESVDLSWLQSISLTSTGVVKDDVYSFDTRLLLNADELLKLAVFMDEKDFYAQLPDLSERWLHADMEQMTARGMNFSAALDFYRDLPEKEKIESLLNRYSAKALEHVKTVNKTREELSAAEISQKAYVLETELSSEEVRALIADLAKTAKEDEELKALILDFAGRTAALYGSADIIPPADQVYEEFQESMDEAIQQAETEEGDVPAVKLTLMVDGKGNVIGRRSVVTTKDGSFATELKLPRAGSRMGVVYAAKTDGKESFRLEGAAGLTGGSLKNISGEFSVFVENEEKAKLNIKRMDIRKLSEGSADFSAELQFLPNAFGESGLPNFDWSALALSVDTNCTDKDGKMVIGISYDGESVLALSSDAALSAVTEKPEAPQGELVDITDEEALIEWAGTIDWNTYIKKLRGTDIPKEWLDLLEMYAQFLP